MTSTRSSARLEGCWHLVEGESLSRSPPTLAVYEVAQSLSLGGERRGILFTEDETRRHFSYLSGIFRQLYLILLLLSSFRWISEDSRKYILLDLGNVLAAWLSLLILYAWPVARQCDYCKARKRKSPHIPITIDLQEYACGSWSRHFFGSFLIFQSTYYLLKNLTNAGK